MLAVCRAGDFALTVVGALPCTFKFGGAERGYLLGCSDSICFLLCRDLMILWWFWAVCLLLMVGRSNADLVGFHAVVAPLFFHGGGRMCFKIICCALGCWGSSDFLPTRKGHTYKEQTAFPGIRSQQGIRGSGHTALSVLPQ